MDAVIYEGREEKSEARQPCVCKTNVDTHSPKFAPTSFKRPSQTHLIEPASKQTG